MVDTDAMDRRALLTRRRPGISPTAEPTAAPTAAPTAEPTTEPTTEPTAEPTTETGPTPPPQSGTNSRNAPSPDHDEFVTPTPQEVAEVVFAGRRIGKRRRSEILRDLELEAGGDSSYYNFNEAPTQLVGIPGVHRSFHAVLALAALALFSGVLFHEDRGGYALEVWVTLPDLAMAICAVLFGPAAIARARRFRTTTLTTGGLLMVAALGLSFVVNPSARGVFVLIRLLGSVGVADRIQRANRAEIRRVAQVLFASAGYSIAFALLQLARGSAIGLYALGEREDPFFHFGTNDVPSAFLGHPYPLGGATLVAAALAAALVLSGRLQPAWLLGGGALAGFACVFSASRTNVLGLCLFVGAVLIATVTRKPKRALLFALIVAASASGAFALDPDIWASKSADYEANGDLSAGRVDLFKENVSIVKRHLPFGVGPGRYNIELQNDGITQSTGFPHPPQVVAMSALAEGGVPAGLALVVIGGSMIGILRRRRIAAAIPLAALAAPLFSDHYMWSGAEGMALVAIGFGVALRLSREPKVRELTPT